MTTLDQLFAKIASSHPPAPTGPVEYIIAGLGNPGSQYDGTRHNIGFLALDTLAQTLNTRIEKLKFQSLTGDALIAGKRVLLIKPHTYMNLSGQAIRDAAAFHKVPMDKVLVIADDVSLSVGSLRIRKKGSDGGHNGLKNIIYLTGRNDFPRIKIGVGQKPRPDYDMVDWVLGKFPPEDMEVISKLLQDIPPICEHFVQGNLDRAMSKYNRTPPKPPRPEEEKPQ